MFEENEDLVLDSTENVEEQATEELVNGAKVEEEVTDSENSNTNTTEEHEKLYTEEDFNKKLDEVIGKKLARKEAKLRREYEDRYAADLELANITKQGIGINDTNEAVSKMSEFYRSKNIDIQPYQREYSNRDMEVLAKSEADDIISSGFDEVVDEVDRLAGIGVDNMTPREKLVFAKLAEYRKAETSRKELASIGVKNEVIDSKEFKDFANQFNSDTPVTKVYELYTKTLDKPTPEKMGSMKNGDTREEKTYYTPEDVDKLTPEELDDPVIFKRVHESMKKWNY